MKIVAVFIFSLLLFADTASAEYRGISREIEETCRVERGLIILAEFRDIRHTIRREDAQRIFFHELNEYVKQMSYE